MWRYCALVLVFSASLRAEELPKGPRLTNVPYELRSVDLPSGARFVLEQDKSRPLAMVAAVVDVGAADDPPGQEGLAHLVEHLAFRTRTDGKRPHTDLLELLGAGTWNAFTTHDITVYFAGAAATALTELLKVETARLLDPLKGVDVQTFDVEREVVRNELRQRNELGEITAVDTALASALYPQSHPYSRPVIGTDASLQTLTLEQARAFASKHYRPEKMTLLVAGDVDPEAIHALLGKGVAAPFLAAPASGPVKPPARLVANPPPPPPIPSGPVLRRIKAAAPVPTLYIAWSLPRGMDDKDAHLQTFAFRALPGAIGAAFKDEQILDIGGSLQRGKLGSTLVLEVLLAEGKDPERAMGQVLDKVISLWFDRRHLLNDDPSYAGPYELRLRVGIGQSITSEALASESLVDRSVQRIQMAHFTGDISYMSREMQSLGKMGAGDVSSFAWDWLARSRARAVYVQPDGTLAAEGGRAAVFAPVSSMKVSVPPEMLAERVTGAGATVRSSKLPNGLEVVVARRASGPVVAATLAARQFQAALYRGTPLARTPSPQDVAKVGPGDANAWMQRTWTPKNSVLTIVGDVDLTAATALAASWLGDWKRPASPVPPTAVIVGRTVDESVPQVATERGDAQQITLRLGCVVPVTTPAQLAAVHVLAERLETRLHQASRLALGATYGFTGAVRPSRGLAQLDIQGAVEERAVARLSALMKRDAEALGKEPITAEDLGRFRWREGVNSSFRYGRSFPLSFALANIRLSGLPEDTLERYPATLAALTPGDVAAVAAECRKTAVIQVVGPPAVVKRFSGPQ
jgi:predicted Zn-dependent peptidase